MPKGDVNLPCTWWYSAHTWKQGIITRKTSIPPARIHFSKCFQILQSNWKRTGFNSTVLVPERSVTDCIKASALEKYYQNFLIKMFSCDGFSLHVPHNKWLHNTCLRFWEGMILILSNRNTRKIRLLTLPFYITINHNQHIIKMKCSTTELGADMEQFQKLSLIFAWGESAWGINRVKKILHYFLYWLFKQTVTLMFFTLKLDN